MTRGRRLPRSSWLLALVLVLSVLTVPDAPPAAADHGQTTVWSATLVAKTVASGFGCDTNDSDVADKCSTTATLTEDEFTYRGVDYTFTSISYASPSWSLTLNSMNLEGFRDLTLHVDNVPVSLADADFVPIAGLFSPSDAAQASLSAPSAGDKVKLSLTREVHAGDLDHTFGIGGKVTTGFGSVTSEIFDMVEQPDGKIVAVGWVANVNRHGNQDVSSKDFAVVRYNPDGSLDTSFGTEGRVLTNFTVPGSHNGGDDEARAVALQSDGKIVVAGYAANPNLGQEFVVARYNVDGSLDTGFGPEYAGSKRGFAVHNFVNNSAQDDVANAVAVQTVGGSEHILVVGQAGNSFGLVRFNSSGGLDGGFGSIVSAVLRSGSATYDFGTLADGATSVAVDAGNKIVVGGFTTNNNGTTSNTNDDHGDFAVLRVSTAGDPDSTFGTSGRVTTNISGTDGDQINDIAIQSNGKIVAAGTSIGNISSGVSGQRLTLARYNTGGALDGEFGTVVSGTNRRGHVTTLHGMSSTNAAQAVAVQSDGKIVAAGRGGDDFSVYRYTGAGELDTGFSTDGKASARIGDDGADAARAVALTDGGGILLGGRAAKGFSDYDFALARFTSAGALDEDGGFGIGGIVTTSFGSDANAHAMAVQSDGKIVAAGYANNDNDTPTNAGDDHDDFVVIRYHPNGTLDASFGTAGRVTTDIGTGSADQAFAVVVDGSGNIVVAGRSSSDGTVGGNDFAVVRYTSAGALDTTFSTDGKVTTDFESNGDGARAVAVDGSGKIVVAGFASDADDLFSLFALARYDTDGSLDTAFDTDGKATSGIDGDGAAAFALAIQSDGKIIAAGEANTGSTNDFTLARYNANGSLDTGFGDIASGSTRKGYVTTAVSSSNGDSVYAVALDDSGGIVAAGTFLNDNGTASETDDHSDFAVARYTSAGVLDTTFNTVGYVTTDIGDQGKDQVYAVAVDGNGKTVVAGFTFNGSDNDFALARYNTNGTLDAGFGSGGKVTTDFGSTNDVAWAVEIDGDGKILAAGKAGGHFALARYLGQTPLSTDATLSGLSVSTSTDGTAFSGTATLSPAFASDTLIYSTTQRSTVTHVKVTPTVTDAKATVTVQGTTTASGTASAAIALTEGTATLVNVLVTAEDGTTTNIYTITVEVDSGDATLSALSVSSSTDGSTFGGTVPLVPAFKPATTSYSAPAEPDVTHVKVTPTVADTNASVTVQGTTTASGSASAAIAVSTGTTTTVSVVVTAQDDQVTRTYTVAVSVGQVATIAVAPNPVGEGSSAQITVTITEAKAAAISIPIVVTAGSAESGDYSAPSSVPIPAGATSGTATLQALQDADTDDETLTVALGTSLPADLNAGSPNSVTVTIDDDEMVSTVSITGTRGKPLGDEGVVWEGETIVVFVGVSPPQPNRITIPLEYADVDSESSDYSGPSSVTVEAGQSYGLAQIRTRHDSDAQNEHFTVSLGANLPPLAAAGTPSAWTITIEDDEFYSAVSIDAVLPDPVLEGETIYVRLRMDPPKPVSVTIPVTLTAGSAEPGDYTTLTSITIPAGQPQGVATLRTNHDTDTDDETLTVSLGDTLPHLVTAGTPNSWTITIEDDENITGGGESSSEVSIARVQPDPVLEGETAYVVLRINPPRPGSVTIPVTLTAGSAEAGDYASLTSITIPAGQLEGVATLRTNHDSDTDDETLTVSLGDTLPDLVTAGTPNSVTFTIEDDDTTVTPRQTPAVFDPEPGNASLLVTWYIRDDHSPYTAFDVGYRAKGTTSWSTATASAALNTGTGSHTISGLTNGTTYEVRVRARNAAGTGPWSYRIEEGTPVAPPAAPTISSVEPPTRHGAGTKLAVTWNAPSTAVTAYHLRWRQQGTSAWQRRGSLDGDNWLANYRTGGQISGLSPGTTYQVQVRALIGNSTGPWSATATGTTSAN